MSPLGWWTISGEALMEMLREVHAGGDPEQVYMEHYANAETHEWPGVVIRAEWRIGHHDRLKRGNPEGVTIDLDDEHALRQVAIAAFVAALDREIGIERRARELSARAT